MTACPRCRGQIVRGSCLLCGWEPVEVTAAPIVAQEAHKHWTAEEEAFALENMTRMTGRELAAALTERFGRRRTWKAVKHWFARKQLAKPAVRRRRARVARKTVEGTPGTRWSEEELEALEAGDLKILGHRSEMALAVQSCRIGTPLRSGDGYLSARQVAHLAGTDHKRVIRLHKADAEKYPAHRNGDLWRFEPAVAEKVAEAVALARRLPVHKRRK